MQTIAPVVAVSGCGTTVLACITRCLSNSYPYRVGKLAVGKIFSEQTPVGLVEFTYSQSVSSSKFCVSNRVFGREYGILLAIN